MYGWRRRAPRDQNGHPGGNRGEIFSKAGPPLWLFLRGSYGTGARNKGRSASRRSPKPLCHRAPPLGSGSVSFDEKSCGWVQIFASSFPQQRTFCSTPAKNSAQSKTLLLSWNKWYEVTWFLSRRTINCWTKILKIRKYWFLSNSGYLRQLISGLIGRISLFITKNEKSAFMKSLRLEFF